MRRTWSLFFPNVYVMLMVIEFVRSSKVQGSELQGLVSGQKDFTAIAL
jgi:hypothetical protein